ncbi:MAG: hypothetical protein CL693_18880 [Cellvibrionaceae bacterium]|nr:hypothetical protein [Cellvibrionaceae bacterium]|tara:strand:+ start:17411 stop:17758 length:348 start_codon:yes stop_codon:yes gene_type:complete
MSFKDVVNSLSNAVGDLSSLSVETYTGKITADIKGSDGQGVIDWEKLVNEAKKDAGGVVNLKLASKFNVDGDATLFIAEGEIPNDVRVAHDSAVHAGQAVRADLMELVSDSIKKL